MMSLTSPLLSRRGQHGISGRCWDELSVLLPHTAALCSRPGWALLALPTRRWCILFSWRLEFYQKLTGLSCLIRAAVLLLMVFCKGLWAEMWIVAVLGWGSSGRPGWAQHPLRVSLECSTRIPCRDRNGTVLPARV